MEMLVDYVVQQQEEPGSHAMLEALMEPLERTCWVDIIQDKSDYLNMTDVVTMTGVCVSADVRRNSLVAAVRR